MYREPEYKQHKLEVPTAKAKDGSWGVEVTVSWQEGNAEKRLKYGPYQAFISSLDAQSWGIISCIKWIDGGKSETSAFLQVSAQLQEAFPAARRFKFSFCSIPRLMTVYFSISRTMSLASLYPLATRQRSSAAGDCLASTRQTLSARPVQALAKRSSQAMVSIPMNTTSSAAIQKLSGSKTIAMVVEIRTSYTITYLTWHLSQTIEKSNHGTRAVDGNGRITLGKLGSTFEDLVLSNVKSSWNGSTAE